MTKKNRNTFSSIIRRMRLKMTLLATSPTINNLKHCVINDSDFCIHSTGREISNLQLNNSLIICINSKRDINKVYNQIKKKCYSIVSKDLSQN